MTTEPIGADSGGARSPSTPLERKKGLETNLIPDKLPVFAKGRPRILIAQRCG